MEVYSQIGEIRKRKDETKKMEKNEKTYNFGQSETKTSESKISDPKTIPRTPVSIEFPTGSNLLSGNMMV
jgi:hypothetical protein